MDLKKLFTQRINLLFGFGTLLPVIMVAVTSVSAIFGRLFYNWSGSSYWFLFVMPQALYPVLSAVLFFFAYGLLGFKVKETVKSEKSGLGPYLIYTPMMIFISVVLANAVDIVFTFFRNIGINLPTVSSAIPTPANAVEAVALIVVMAVLPALCEEFIYRLTFVGILSPLSRGGAILISSIAFGLMHGTLEQIPATFVLGLGLAFIYNRTGNYRLPVVIHFINNLISCVFVLIYEYASETVISIADTVFAIAVPVLGTISVGVFLLTKKRTAPTVDSPCQIKTGETLLLAFKAPMFWVFTGVYLCVTVVNTVLYAILPV